MVLEHIAEIQRRIVLFREQNSNCSDINTIKRLVQPIVNLNMLEQFSLSKCDARIYWSNRDNSEVVVGLGVATTECFDTKKSLSQTLDCMKSKLRYSDKGIRYYGGCAFDPVGSSSTEWKSFGAFRFVVPLIEFIKRGNDFFIAYNHINGDEEYCDSILELIRIISQNSTPVNFELTEQYESTSKHEWNSTIANAVHSLDGSLNKVVLARCKTIDFEKPINTAVVMDKLFKCNRSTYDFCFEFDKHNSFVGSSPECLYRRDNDKLYCEAVAGTTYGNNQSQILDSQKDILEQELVHNQILNKIQGLCEEVDVCDNKIIMKLSELSHLCSSFNGKLNQGVSDTDILHTIHPTAAVCGSPTKDALDLIRDVETFDRGWYSGPVGWISADSSEFAVAIRSALINHNKVHIYAGAGIVNNSLPQMEWNEINKKMAQFINLFSHSNSQ